MLEFPASVDGPWSRYVVGRDDPPGRPQSGNSAGEPAARPYQIGTARYPRLVPKDADCAKKLAKRTLTNLYNERPTWLANAHATLDTAVFASYGWPVALTDAEILERLLALNLAR